MMRAPLQIRLTGALAACACALMAAPVTAQGSYSPYDESASAALARYVRTLALSRAISGDRNSALQMLAPLSARGDSGVPRVRAFVLALTGDSNAAMTAINAAMPGSWARVAPFVQRLPSLSAGQRAAAVNLGIFPDTGDTSYASATTPAPPADRLARLEAPLPAGPPQPAAPAPAPPGRRS